MKYKRSRIGLLIGLVLIAAGCAQVPKDAGFNDVKDLVEQRVDYRLQWNRETETDRRRLPLFCPVGASAERYERFPAAGGN